MTKPVLKFPEPFFAGASVVTNQKYRIAYRQSPFPRVGKVLAAAADQRRLQILFEGTRFPQYVQCAFLEMAQ